MSVIYGLFTDPESAQRAVNDLQGGGTRLGIQKEQLVVVSAEPFEGYPFSDEHAKSNMFFIASIGGIVGGLAGYALTTLTQRSYPINTGGMSITPWWTNGIIIYELTMLGAILSSLVTLLLQARLPHMGTSVSDPEIWNGKILVGVSGLAATARPELESQLRRAGAVEVKEWEG